MDIDEFLDRELSELDLGMDKTKNLKANEEFQEIGENFEPSTLFENIKSSLDKGNIGEAEQSYAQLWRILLKQRLKWDKELYSQLLILSRQFLSVLNKTFNEIRKKADYIYDLIKKARTSLREGKKDMPYRMYSEIMGINNSIPNVFFEEKRKIQEQIAIFYEELKNTTDNELVKRVYNLIQETNQLIDKISILIRSNDYISAIANYNKCVELYNQVPEGFLRNKISLGMRLLEIYKSLSIYNEVSDLQKQIGQQPLPFQQKASASLTALLNEKRERAKKNIEKGFYNEAFKDIEEALKLEPHDAESKVIHAKIKTLS